MSRFSVDTHLFRELGRLLVGRDSTALVELVKNSYDADATQVVVHGEGLAHGGEGRIVIVDNGNGMTPKLFTSGFLTIASRGKEEGLRRSLRFGRRFTGAKGVGRLAAHKLAERIEIFSMPHTEVDGAADGGVSAIIDWAQIEQYEKLEDVPPSAIAVQVVPNPGKSYGTTIRLERLRRSWSDAVRATFLREVESFLVPQSLLADPANEIAGSPLFDAPVVYDIGKRRSQPFSVKFTGDLEVGEDHFANIFSSADWLIEVDSPKNSGTYIVSIQPTRQTQKSNPHAEGRVFRLRRPAGAPAFQARVYSRWGKAWERGGIRVYQEGFRVLPYGEPNNDWLELDAVYKQRDRRLRFLDKVGLDPGDSVSGEGLSSIGNRGFFGAVLLTVDGAPELEMLVNREGFVPNETFDLLRSMLQTAVQLNIRERARITAGERVARREKRAGGLALAADRTPVESIDDAINAISALDRLPSDSEKIASITAIRNSLVQVQDAVATVVDEASTMRLLAAIGLQLSAFLHEIRGLLVHVRELEDSVERLKQNLSGSKDRTEASRLKGRVADLRRAIERQTAYLEDVATADARRRRSKQSISETLISVVRLYSPEMARKEVEFIDRVSPGVKTPVPMFSAELVLVFSNLMSNALKAVDSGGKIMAHIDSSPGTLGVFLSNTGERVDLDGSERWFHPFESTSSDPEPLLGRGMGLGLTIVREMLEDYSVKVGFVQPPSGFATSVCITFPAP